MTPFELTLQSELDVEWQRFANEWLFKWHNINIEGHVVDVEDFRGGNFHTGGIVFQGQIQDLYWQAIGRYLSAKIHATFKSWDEETRSYPAELRRSSLEGTQHCLVRFAAAIIERATDTDRRLRGQGYPQNVQAFNSTGYHSGANAEIFRLAESHRVLFESSVEKKIVPSIMQRIEEYFSSHKGIIAVVSILIAVIFGALGFFLG